jgi:hypothetical protein
VANFKGSISEQAKKLLGEQKEEVVIKTGTVSDDMPEAPRVLERVELPKSFKMTIDAPKELWEAVGHIQLEFIVADYDEVMAKIGELTGLWAAVKEDFAEEFAKADLISDKQVSLLKRLLGVKELSDEMKALSKDDASVKIEELMKEKPSAGASRSTEPSRSSGGSRYQRRSSEPAPAPKSGGYKPGGGGVSEATIKYAEQISKRKRVELPSDFVMWSQAEASDWIADNK